MPVKKREIINRKREKIFAIIKERIVEGYYSPGEKLVERVLVEEFNISRTQCRQIFHELFAQGLIQKKRNQTNVVRKIDPRSLLEIMDIREVLEGLAARLAAENGKKEDWKDLKDEFGAPFDEIVKKQEFEKYMDLITKLRYRILSVADNEELKELILSMWAKIYIIQRRIIILPGRIQEAVQQHRNVLDALIEGDAEKAERMKRLNIRSGREYLVKYKTWVL